jgi:mono/diheme cytochrome c family protein
MCFFLRRSVLVVPVLVLLLVATGCASEETAEPADVEETPSEVVALTGQQLYERHCQSCHGPEGKGQGSMTDELTKDLPDLTQLQAQNDGVFPEEYVRRMIDGREMISAHGTRQMPIWGNIWASSDGVPSEEQAARQRIDKLINFLRSIQETS